MPKQLRFFISYNKKMKELKKIDKLIEILNESNVGEIIENALGKDTKIAKSRAKSKKS